MAGEWGRVCQANADIGLQRGEGGLVNAEITDKMPKNG